LSHIHILKSANMKYFLSLIACLFIVVACKPSEKDRVIEGQWYGADWTINGQPAGYNVGQVAFQFNPDGTYQYAYQDLEESGVYFITGQELYTTPDGGTKIMVKLKTLTADTLQMEMNRGGQLELLTLTRN
jgi:hypothetical protein